MTSRFENWHGLQGVSRDTFLEIVTGWAKLSRVTFLEIVTGYIIYVTGYFLFRGGNQLKYRWSKKVLSTRHKLRKVFKIFFQKNAILFQKYEKIRKSKTDLKRPLRALIRFNERFAYFSQTWNLTISKNTNVNQRKSNHYEKFNFSREKLLKR